MEINYAVFILLLYIVLVLLGIWCCEYREKRKARRRPVPIPLLNDREKRKKLNLLIKPLGFAYDGKQDIFYSRTDSWQRKYGCGHLYDEGAALLHMIVDCEPIYFDYDKKKWLIEFRKGQYGITTGGEAEVCYLPEEEFVGNSLFHEMLYHCVEDEDTLRVKTVLWKRGRKLFYRRGYHWWLSGFVPGEFSKPKDLEMDIEVTLKDMEMRDAFLQGLYRAGYHTGELSVIDNTVWVHFAAPHTRQPMTKSRIFSAAKQWKNKADCRLYRKVTGDYDNAYDKLLALQVRAPKLYQRMERIGKNKMIQRGESHVQL